MASSITVKSDVYKGSRYFELVCTQKSNGSAENSSTITWTLYAKGDSVWYDTGPTTVVINGTTVYSKDRVGWEAGKFPVAQGSTDGTITIPHNNDGTKTITVKFSTAVYTTTQKEYSGTWELDDIPRYADITSIEKSDITETSVKMSWEADSTIDLVQYKNNSATSWTNAGTPNAKKGSFTISGLTPNTEQNIDVRFKRKDSGLYTNVSMGAFKTYDYPHCTSAPDFVIGKEVALGFYNPLNRTFSFTIVGNGVEIFTWPDRTGTTYKGIDGEPAVTNLYASIPKAKSAKYSVKVVYGTSTKTKQGGTYSIDESKCLPTFTAFTYKDTNATVTAITGNNQALVKGLSTLSVEISSANKMVAKNSATPDYYSVSVDTLTKTGKYNATNAVTIPVGVISSAGAKRLNVRAYDSRGLSALAHKDVTVYGYNKPKFNASATRLNDFEATTTLKISGEYSRLTIGGTDKNTIKSVGYRIRETGGTWPTNYTAITPTLSAGKFTHPDITLSLDNTKSFEIEVKATDNFGDSMAGKVTLTVDIGQAVFFVSSNMKKCYHNGEEVAVIDDVPRLKGYTAIPDGTDLNKIVQIGTFRSTSWDHTKTMSNFPDIVDGGFKLIVSGWTGDSDYTTGLRQDVYFSNTHHVRRTLDGGATWGGWRQIAYVDNIVNMAFPVGSVYITNSNTNPATLLGRGTWTLIDKGFASSATNNANYFTAGANVVSGGTWVTRAGQTIRIRQNVTVNTSITDTGLTLGTFNFDNIGIKQMPANVVGSVTYSDGANGGIAWNINETTGELSLTDVFDLTTIPSGNTFCIDITFPMIYSQMIDSVCDKFYWKRTA